MTANLNSMPVVSKLPCKQAADILDRLRKKNRLTPYEELQKLAATNALNDHKSDLEFQISEISSKVASLESDKKLIEIAIEVDRIS